ncbi:MULTISPECIES: alpha/beta fold hydrolase [Tsukamurella]|uniref:Alpha/beta hydrolase n=2 Tax=Tsukamurella TaxID=2060 RepID=A0A5C5S2E1_9ACTN|nr:MULTISPECIES: alpha/beta fold hydrolase [Tsukamurella]NMD56041.1 alpha/beta hydrolase [Tsukamurella columbiensis]TWS28848.1 alpha/beta hydrolase [Tsukamurella conjunctivitidis]
MTFHTTPATELDYFDDHDGDDHGAPLVLLHGTGTDGDLNFGHLLPALSGRRVIRPNLPGSGPEPDLDGVDLDGIVERIATLHDRTHPEGPVDVLGFSLGAVLAAAYAGRYPGRVGRLILLAGWAAPDPRHQLFMGLWRRLADLDDRAYGEFLVLTLFSPQFVAGLGDGVEEAVRSTLPTPGTSRQIDLDATIDIRSLAARITAPTLLIAGTEDVIAPPSKVRELGGLIGAARTRRSTVVTWCSSSSRRRFSHWYTTF